MKNDLILIDYKYFTINYSTLLIEPDPLEALPKTDCTFTVKTDVGLPADVKYVWEFGDQTPAVTRILDNTVTRTFTKEGEYGIGVSLYNSSTNELINYKSALATITAGLLETVKSSDRVSLDFMGDFTNTGYYLDGYFNIAQFQLLQPGEYTLAWTGNSFNFDFSKNTYGYFNWDTTRVYGNMNGELSGDGTTILSMTGYQVVHNNLGTDSLTYGIELSNLQYSDRMGRLVYYEVRGPATANTINRIELRRNQFIGEPYNNWSEAHLVSIDYNSSSTAFLTVSFYPKLGPK
jgi:hypothetical protein